MSVGNTVAPKGIRVDMLDHAESMAAYDRLPPQLRQKLAYAPFEISAPSVLWPYLMGLPLAEIEASVDRAIQSVLEAGAP